MNPPLPPLGSLRAFEAAARTLSFSQAADELHVTPAAVSHQIRGLEEQLGTALFRRLNRKVELTEAGALLLPGVADGFARLREAVGRVRARHETGTLTVSAAPTFAAKWLVLRLDSFREQHPEIDIRLSATDILIDFERHEVDIAVRYGAGRYDGLGVELLMRSEVFPVASPKLLPIDGPEQLGRQVLLHDDTALRDPGLPDWRMWLRAAGSRDIDPSRGPRLGSTMLTLEAAAAGKGVALVNDTLAAGDLASGRLVRLFELALPDAFAYWVVYPPGALDRPKVRAFRDWLFAEADGFRR
jgi:LysR family glycine cleavage system transcriptional activator